ncbi:molybdate ABC transporter substrate-binding protein [Puia sp. P3]|uniref:molybdate ABC transporter substrate-binding protein n=1 Tax=Puia sp. P3 TaxID=3423952 RepID=UPI003D67A52D
MRRALLYLLITLAATLPLQSFHPSHPPQSSEVLIAAAADLKFAMDSAIAVFTRTNPTIKIKVVYGSSGNFFQQISNGAPFDLFFSADVDYPRRLQQKQLTLSDPKLYGIGRLVLWSKELDPAMEGMNTLLNNSIKKIAIANPQHAPYGKRAEESLRYYQLYDKIKDKLVLGENIAQTAQYAQSGAADVGIIALSLALSPAMQQTGGKFWLIPATAHQPLQQGYALLPHAVTTPAPKNSPPSLPPRQQPPSSKISASANPNHPIPIRHRQPTAMNTLHGHITSITTEQNISLVKVLAEGYLFHSLIIDTPSTSPWLKEGAAIRVLFKETEVMIALPHFRSASATSCPAASPPSPKAPSSAS